MNLQILFNFRWFLSSGKRNLLSNYLQFLGTLHLHALPWIFSFLVVSSDLSIGILFHPPDGDNFGATSLLNMGLGLDIVRRLLGDLVTLFGLL